ncbi:dihydropteroate synthase [Ralstonia solanacearum]|uniref:Dihydropteroate synthase n=3 Tax=Ralstonia solanacearum species complex TaxID=3116862 RepID=A0A0S4WVS2_RALSL|nr:Dihydropteroate synthase [Ralstonia pseudosolanacearum FQY_4]AOE89815.1 Dihydropteroate synthase [Ralstonia solanacearum]ESS48109.1 dihydropteroate synthase [Ralstonia solanacearum SD54]BEU46973.1 dihydropteroate synthase [Ralstonia pseudosolanacearum]KAF3459803.1 dihydropteroate synthase [Ralstonia solanacearum]
MRTGFFVGAAFRLLRAPCFESRTLSVSIPTTTHFQCGRFRYPRDRRPLVMGILNVTPDSFSDGGRHATRDAALRHAEQLIAEGADLIDIGGESSRPGAAPLGLQEELDRVMPIVEALRECGRPLSIDTYKPDVMRATLDAGADLINDIWGFRKPGAIEAVAQGHAGLCLMHMQRDPETMQEAPSYTDLMAEVGAFLQAQAQVLLAAGVAAERIALDPGFGFGKTPDHNLIMLNRLEHFERMGLPLLVGLSRKSTLGAVLGGKPPAERITASVAAALLAAERGAFIVRVHDVRPTVEAIQLWWAMRHERIDPPVA